MNFTIRPARASDFPAIRPLQVEIAEHHRKGRPELFKPDAATCSEEAFLSRLQNSDHTILVAEDEAGLVVAYAFCWVNHIRNHPTYVDFDQFYIGDICVHAPCKRSGIGKALFAQCKEIAREKNCRSMELGVWAFNVEAVSFYKAMGMRERVLRMELPL
ncbi:MAG: GNAT family N-acetyltransferase [Clostridia bacterium]|nr:GNAT family N-acetyltransferase [Clostridia bacterium]